MKVIFEDWFYEVLEDDSKFYIRNIDTGNIIIDYKKKENIVDAQREHIIRMVDSMVTNELRERGMLL